MPYSESCVNILACSRRTDHFSYEHDDFFVEKYKLNVLVTAGNPGGPAGPGGPVYPLLPWYPIGPCGPGGPGLPEKIKINENHQIAVPKTRTESSICMLRR